MYYTNQRAMSLPRESLTANILSDLEMLRHIKKVLVAKKEHSLDVKIELVIVWVLCEHIFKKQSPKNSSRS
jgi:hypothetical protein